MAGIFVLLALSWILLYFFRRTGLAVLGYAPIAKRLLQFLIGVLFAGALCMLIQVCHEAWQKAHWIVVPTAALKSILYSFYWSFRSVLTEELMFRGALLYVLLQTIGTRKALALSAIAFGVYHWFSYGLFGNAFGMLIVFVSTGLMGWVWAYSFYKTSSMVLAIGLHLGWNFVYNLLSKGPLGYVWLKAQGGTQIDGWFSLVDFLMPIILVPLFSYWLVKYCFSGKNTVVSSSPPTLTTSA